jgi:hypothetical protein
VDEDAGCVDDAAEQRPSGRDERLGQPLAQVSRIRPASDLLPGTFEHGSRCGEGEQVVGPPHQLIDRWKVAQPHELSVEPTKRLPCKS